MDEMTNETATAIARTILAEAKKSNAGNPEDAILSAVVSGVLFGISAIEGTERDVTEYATIEGQMMSIPALATTSKAKVDAYTTIVSLLQHHLQAATIKVLLND